MKFVIIFSFIFTSTKLAWSTDLLLWFFLFFFLFQRLWTNWKIRLEQLPSCRDFEYTDCILCSRVGTLQKSGVLGMTLNYIWQWDYNSGYLGSVGYPLIFITPKLAVTQNDTTCKCPIYRINRSVLKLFIFDWTVCKKNF